MTSKASSLQPFSNRSEPARGSSLHTIKTQQKAKEEEEKIKMKRRKGIVTLMLQFCQEMGYARTLDSLQTDSGLMLGKSTMAADNIDLATVVTEYEDYYEYRFGRKPRLYRAPTEGEAAAEGLNLAYDGGGEGTMSRRPAPAAGRRANGGGAAGGGLTTPPPSAPSANQQTYSSCAQPPSSAPPQTGARGSANAAAGGGTKAAGTSAQDTMNIGAMSIGGNAIKVTAAPGGGLDDHFKKNNGNGGSNGDNEDDDDDIGVFSGGRALKPMPKFLTQDLAELAGTIQRDILDTNPNVRFDHIAELTVAKQLLKEAVVMPVKYPELFAGLLRPWKGVLLYGPPGTGKTMLAKAVATECKTTFFNISASSIVSKWRGDSEKLVRMLFDLAVHYAPSTIFIDELDSILSARSSDGSEHEGSRRMKTELLIQIDGLSKRRNGDIVFVLGASNVPWDLDAAILRRLEKRILVSLPSEAARADMIRANLMANAGKAGKQRNPNKNSSNVPAVGSDAATASGGTSSPSSSSVCPLSEAELLQAAKATEGYSGADIDIVCREATMRTIRKLIVVLEESERQSGGGGHASAMMRQSLHRPAVTFDDVMASIGATNPSTHSTDLSKYQQWADNFGSTMSK